MKNGKFEVAFYTFYDHTTMETHFEKMAAKGWALDRMGIFWHYRRIEPAKLRYAVGYFPGGGIYGPVSEGEMTFEDYCAEAGWNLTAEHGEIKVFCNANEDPVPLETQADIQVENIREASERAVFIRAAAALIGWVGILWFLASAVFDSVKTLSSGLGCTWAVLFLCLGISSTDELITYYRWYKRAKANADRDQSFTPTWSHRGVQGAALTASLAVLAVWAVTVGETGRLALLIFGTIWGLYYLTDLIRTRMRRRGLPTVANIAVNFTVVAVVTAGVITGYFHFTDQDSVDGRQYYDHNGFRWSQEEDVLPLALAELKEGAAPLEEELYTKTYNTQQSLLLSRLSAEESGVYESSGNREPEEYYMQYIVAKVHLDLLYDYTLHSMLRTYAGEEAWTAAEEWELPDGTAGRAYQLSYERQEQRICRYVICMQDRVVKMDLSFEPDAEQRARMTEKLAEI